MHPHPDIKPVGHATLPANSCGAAVATLLQLIPELGSLTCVTEMANHNIKLFQTESELFTN